MNASTNPRVRLTTRLGSITLELFPDKAPETVANFLRYVDEGFYPGTLFHRVIPNFMVQGGGLLPDMSQKPNNGPIRNEAQNGLTNTRGSIAMARTPDPHSATSQFFINVKDNGFLNFSAPNPQGFGYCVFGQVVDGMSVVDAIVGLPTGNRYGHSDVPADDVTIDAAERVSE
ncbi:MAG: peptidylprolyl isomerase [Halothiobacillaceae bacterium]|jgi:cyclophilin family peptidyl-prolyl cis-trans isomerase|nr:peptidylprolyl isomerase [Halothiobacillaceae bacterium]